MPFPSTFPTVQWLRHNTPFPFRKAKPYVRPFQPQSAWFPPHQTNPEQLRPRSYRLGYIEKEFRTDTSRDVHTSEAGALDSPRPRHWYGTPSCTPWQKKLGGISKVLPKVYIKVKNTTCGTDVSNFSSSIVGNRWSMCPIPSHSASNVALPAVRGRGTPTIKTLESGQWLKFSASTHSIFLTPNHRSAASGNAGALERKSFTGSTKTVIRARKRFHAELRKLAECKHACVVVEGSLREVLDGNHTGNAHPNAVFGAATSICVD